MATRSPAFTPRERRPRATRLTSAAYLLHRIDVHVPGEDRNRTAARSGCRAAVSKNAWMVEARMRSCYRAGESHCIGAGKAVRAPRTGGAGFAGVASRRSRGGNIDRSGGAHGPEEDRAHR